jgi:hypothetical protein
MTEDERNRLRERFASEREDRPQRRRSNKTTTSDVFRNISAVLFAVLVAVWVLNRPNNVPPVTPVADRSMPTAPPSQPTLTPEPITSRASIKPQPLSDCIKADNVIDESVVTCRYGKYPTPKENPNAQGMVSAQYMEKFKDQQYQRAAVRHEQFVETFWIRQWDGRATHLAQWSVVDNQIDSTSVCANQRRGSIEYRECRKGAKVWFKEQCRDGSHGQAAHLRYCSAANGFSPMG